MTSKNIRRYVDKSMMAQGNGYRQFGREANASCVNTGADKGRDCSVQTDLEFLKKANEKGKREWGKAREKCDTDPNPWIIRACTEINCPRPVRRIFFTIHRNGLKYLVTLVGTRSPQLMLFHCWSLSSTIDRRIPTEWCDGVKNRRKEGIVIYRRHYWPRQVSMIDRKFWRRWLGSFEEKRRFITCRGSLEVCAYGIFVDVLGLKFTQGLRSNFKFPTKAASCFKDSN